MRKNFLFIILLFCSCFGVCGCSKEETIILFNHRPITKDTVLNNATVFEKGKRIYYILISEKPFEAEGLRVRIFKRDKKINDEPVKLIYSNDFKLQKDQRYYYTDYIVMDETGTFCMLIYSLDKLKYPIAIADFKVKG